MLKFAYVCLFDSLLSTDIVFCWGRCHTGLVNFYYSFAAWCRLIQWICIQYKLKSPLTICFCRLFRCGASTQNSRSTHKCSILSSDRPTMQTTSAVMKEKKINPKLVNEAIKISIFFCFNFGSIVSCYSSMPFFSFLFIFIDCKGIHRAFSWIEIWSF